MKQETVEKPTCQYRDKTIYMTRTGCGIAVWTDEVKNYNYCPNCGRKVEREQHAE